MVAGNIQPLLREGLKFWKKNLRGGHDVEVSGRLANLSDSNL
jgi:hypothetical protein